MNMIRRAFACEIERVAGSAADGVPIVASTDAIDRYGEVVEQDWRLDNYKRNPVVLWSHDPHDLPIGKALDVRVDNGKLKARIVFAAHAKAQEIAQLWNDGFLNAISVGFYPTNVRFEKRDGKDVPVLSGNELLEISVVGIPANPEALAEERAFLRSIAGGSPAHMRDMDQIRKAFGIAADATEDQIVEQLTARGAELVSKALAPVLAAVGAETIDAALGTIGAMKSAAERVPVLEAEIAKAAKAAEETEKSALLGKLKSEGRATPAQLEAFASMSLDFVRAFEKTAPRVILEPAVEQPSAPSTKGVKTWAEHSTMELHALAQSNPELYAQLRKEHLARSKGA